MLKVFINPGHSPNGDPDCGASNPNTGLRESDVVANIGPLVAKYLNAVGIETQLLQSDSLEDICAQANGWPADLFVSIHCNSAPNDEANGVEVWACNGSNEAARLAQCLDDQVFKSIHELDRGLKIATPHVNGLYVLSNTNMPAVLVETAFISNDGDEKLLETKQDDFAKAIARGVTDYML
jgi:N-acetylmuramoyl-L-alanine amidase